MSFDHSQPIKACLLVGHDHDVLLESAIYALRNHDNLFKRGGRLVTVVRPSKIDDEAKLLDESPQIREVTAATLACMLTSVADWTKAVRRKGEIVYVHTDPPARVVQAVLDAGEYPEIRQLIGFSETPIVDRNLQINECEGYDEDTGIYFWPNAEFLPLPRKATQEDAREAYKRLTEPISQFPFDPLGLGRAVYVSAILTVLARSAIDGATPLHLLTKNTRGAGATLLADAISIVATGRPASRMTFPEDPIEQEKVLGAIGLSGMQFVCFDNVTALGGGPLDKCITAKETVGLRILGQSRIANVVWRTFVLVTGNNVEIECDTMRRTIAGTLFTPEERPELRQGWAIQDLCAHMREHRVEMVRDAMTIVSAFRTAGRPQCGVKPLGSFEEWSRVVASMVVFAGGENPITAYAEATGVGDAKTSAISVLLAHFHLLPNALAGLTVREILATLYAHPPWSREPAPPDGLDELRSAVEALVPTPSGKVPNGKALGKMLATVRKRVIGGQMFDSSSAHGGAMRWKVVPVASSAKVPDGGLGVFGGLLLAGVEERKLDFTNGNGVGASHPSHPTHPGHCEDADGDLERLAIQEEGGVLQ